MLSSYGETRAKALSRPSREGELRWTCVTHDEECPEPESSAHLMESSTRLLESNALLTGSTYGVLSSNAS